MSEDRYSETLLGATRIHNLRDVGGLPLAGGGRVRPGVLYRAAQLGPSSSQTLAQLAELDLDVVFDLRSDDESERVPDSVPDGVRQVQLDVLADSAERIAASLEDAFEDPVGASELLMSGLVEEHYVATYRNLVTLDSARSSYAQLFTVVASGKRALFHCTAGKDRTGWAAASLHLLVGVPMGAVMDHFLASNAETTALFGGVMAAFAEAGGDADALAPVFMVDDSYLEAAVEEMQSEFGTIERYFADGLGLSDDQLESLKENLTEG